MVSRKRSAPRAESFGGAASVVPFRAVPHGCSGEPGDACLPLLAAGCGRLQHHNRWIAPGGERCAHRPTQCRAAILGRHHAKPQATTNMSANVRPEPVRGSAYCIVSPYFRRRKFPQTFWMFGARSSQCAAGIARPMAGTVAERAAVLECAVHRHEGYGREFAACDGKPVDRTAGIPPSQVQVFEWDCSIRRAPPERLATGDCDHRTGCWISAQDQAIATQRADIIESSDVRLATGKPTQEYERIFVPSMVAGLAMGYDMAEIDMIDW